MREKHLATKTKAIAQLVKTIYTYMKSHLGMWYDTFCNSIQYCLIFWRSLVAIFKWNQKDFDPLCHLLFDALHVICAVNSWDVGKVAATFFLFSLLLFLDAFICCTYKCFCKVHIFWESHKILRNLQLTFVLYYLHRTKLRWRFCKILWLPQNIWTLQNI